MRPWNNIHIEECGEPCVKLSDEFHLITPHPYFSIGAPYGALITPWFLRAGVHERLNNAQNYLQQHNESLCFAVFDALRPISVQNFMIEYTINQLCKERGVSRYKISDNKKLDKIKQDVEKFWAPPSLDAKTPPPHSTGSAIDLTLAQKDGTLLEMGGAIDAIGDISYPNYYLLSSARNQAHNIWHQRRTLLSKVMLDAGFIQHPNEWWHFSYGDQLWAWKSNLKQAIYGTTN